MAPKLTQTIKRVALSPLTAVYALVIAVRHKLFDRGVYKSEAGALPTLVLGNIHVGGTGKTPHASYFLRILSEKLGGPEKVALLSRGYKRTSKGFFWVETDGDWRKYGDEPALLKNLNPSNPIAVCEDRIRGIKQIKKERPEVRVVILDDGLQHRKLLPTKSVFILDSDRPLKNEALLPAGNLRDLKSRLKTADAIVIARSKQGLKEEVMKQGLSLENIPVFTSYMQEEDFESAIKGKPRILAISGIAEPERFMDSLTSKWSVVRRESYSDHHMYSEKDVEGWLASIRNEKLDGIVTTSKDAVRIKPLIAYRPEIKMHSICIGVKWHEEEAVQQWLDQWLESTIFAQQ